MGAWLALQPGAALGQSDSGDPSPADQDADGVPDLDDNCPSLANPDQANLDGDARGDACDNCLAVPNDPVERRVFQTTTGGQLDDDADGYGNACDADFDNRGRVVDSTDFRLLVEASGRLRRALECGATGTDSCTRFDLDGLGVLIDGSDLRVFEGLYGVRRGTGLWSRCAACGDFERLPCAGPACPPAPGALRVGAVEDLDPTRVRISWQTARPARAELLYGASPTTLRGRIGLNRFATADSLVLSGLAPLHRYYFVLTTTDEDGVSTSAPLTSFRTGAATPNVLFVLLDDLGYGDPGSYGGTGEATPHIDELAAQGMRFTQFYANGPVCSPSRAALLTGRHPAEFGFRLALRPADLRGLPPDVVTLPGLLRERGYATGHFGKWHLGTSQPQFLPAGIGFDRSAIRDGNGSYRDPALSIDGGPPTPTAGHLTEITTNHALEFIRSHQNQNFFANVWYHAPHTPFEPPAEWLERFSGPLAEYRALVAHVDSEIERLLSLLEELDLVRHTLVIVTSDNGPIYEASNGPLRDGKTSLSEGGIRVPFIASWPARIAAGSVNPGVFAGHDLLPTLAELVGIDPSTLGLEGTSAARALLEGEAAPRPGALVWDARWRNAYSGDTPQEETLYDYAVRRGDWKLRVQGDRPAQLYDLARDPGEANDLAALHPGEVAALEAELRAWRERVGPLDCDPVAVEGDVRLEPDQLDFGDGAARLETNTRFYVGKGDFGLQADVRTSGSTREQVIAEYPGAWRLAIAPDGSLQLVVQDADGVTSAQLSASTRLQAGVTHHVAFDVFGWLGEPSTIRLYLDHRREAEQNLVRTVAAPAGVAVQLGNSTARDAPLHGTLSNLRCATRGGAND